ncbi:hypothetical protein AB0K89_26195 [Streptomyces cinnamoneus]|uniref:hypothetical protein n=1 Tax=Streptomyces cinnamoneus TaxID=53446 RepID=UPI003418D059
MSARTAFRTVSLALAAATLALTAAQGAQAAPRTAPAGAVAPAAGTAGATASDENPFRHIDLEGLRAEKRFMYPAGHPVAFWALVLDDERVSRTYRGGTFFVYAPATGEFGWMLDTDIATRTVKDPRQVVIADLDFLNSHPRVEVRYGNPDQPRKARTVARTTIWMH